MDYQNIESTTTLNKFIARVFGRMFLGLITTTIVALAVYLGFLYNAAFHNFVVSYSGAIYAVVILEVILVFFISARINKLEAQTAKFLFILYSALNGLSIGLLCLVFQTAVFKAFLVAAVIFAILAIYGYKTSVDLTKVGTIMLVGLFGLIAMSIINIFLASGSLDFFICIVGLVIFLALTAYDMQKLKSYYYNTVNQGEATISKAVTMGALALYLDFINIFIFLLRLFGGGRD